MNKMAAAIQRVSKAFGCDRDSVEISFGYMRDAEWWTVTVRTPRPDRRTKASFETRGSAESLNGAVAEVLARAATHTMS